MLELPFFDTEGRFVIFLICSRYGTDYLDFCTHFSWLLVRFGMLLFDYFRIELGFCLLGSNSFFDYARSFYDLTTLYGYIMQNIL